MDKKEMWKKAVDFHGHECGGLTLGYKVAQLAIKDLDIDFSKDEELVCIAENDACSVDAIQAILGCSIGKGNLILRITGKQAYSFYNRKNGKSVRYCIKNFQGPANRKEGLAFYKDMEPEEIFSSGPVKEPLPEKARLFASFICDECHEKAGVAWLHKVGDRNLCADCAAQVEK